MEVINNRRSVRKFLDKKISEEQIERLLRAAMQAPTAGNGQCWEFVVVTDKDVLSKLSKSGQYTKPLETATLGIVVIGNKNIARFPEFWEQDCAAATENILLEATYLGLGSVWMGVAPNEDKIEAVSKVIALNQDEIYPVSMIAIGYPEKEDANHFVDRFDKDKIHYQKY